MSEKNKNFLNIEELIGHSACVLRTYAGIYTLKQSDSVLIHRYLFTGTFQLEA